MYDHAYTILGIVVAVFLIAKALRLSTELSMLASAIAAAAYQVSPLCLRCGALYSSFFSVLSYFAWRYSAAFSQIADLVCSNRRPGRYAGHGSVASRCESGAHTDRYGQDENVL